MKRHRDGPSSDREERRTIFLTPPKGDLIVLLHSLTKELTFGVIMGANVPIRF